MTNRLNDKEFLDKLAIAANAFCNKFEDVEPVIDDFLYFVYSSYGYTNQYEKLKANQDD